MKRIILIIMSVILLASFVYAGAQWYPTTPKYEMKQKLYSNYCPLVSQCLVGVGPEFNSSKNGMPELYFSSVKPRCINNTQYILDYYCDNGVWSSRTKLIALTLINFANRVSPGNFVVYCDKYDAVLNQVNYDVPAGRVGAFFSDYRCFNQSAPCINHLCVLEYQGRSVVGASFNVAVNDPSNSLLLAMNASASACNGVSSSAVDFTRCGTTDFFYNPAIKSIIYLPAGNLQPGVNYASLHLNHIKPNLDALNNYARSIGTVNLSFFTVMPLFNRFYYSEKGGRKIFAFEEVEQTDLRHSYLGARYLGYAFDNSTCTNIFKQYAETGLTIYCGVPALNDLLLIGKKTPGTGGISAWQDFTSKLRPK
ncbi:MAG: hypothetical protein QW666_00530 [Candidatus Woesearchaeota archaeon]